MLLYSRTGASSVHIGGATYEAGPDGGFDLPDHVAAQVHTFHVGGQPLWEDHTQRQQRLVAEELERRKDPATLLDAVNQLVAAAQAQAAVPPPAPARPRSRGKAAGAT